MTYYIFYAIIMFAGLAMTVREGLWSNTLTLVNIIVSGLVAFGFYAPLVVYLDEDVTNGQHTYWLDFAILWALYCVTMIVMRTLMGAASKTRMRFKHPIDPVGGPIVGLIAAWVLASFALATFHTAPMPKDAFSGKLVASNEIETASIITSPDAAWLKFIQRMSQSQALASSRTIPFSARAFPNNYADHRAKFEKAPSLIVPRGK